MNIVRKMLKLDSVFSVYVKCDWLPVIHNPAATENRGNSPINSHSFYQWLSLVIVKVSRATAVREIDHLMRLGIIKQNPGRGRSASYELSWEKM